DVAILDLRSFPTRRSSDLGDAFRLKQILFNLVGNAIKFTDEGEVLLQVSATHYGAHTEINYRVRDSGPGIAEEDIDKVFHEFEQDRKSTRLNSSHVKISYA